MNSCNCECVQGNSISVCTEFMQFDLGVLNADKELTFNITGRSKRIYAIQALSDEDGFVNIPTENLPAGYISIFSTKKYKVWFEDEDSQSLQIKDSGLFCIEFSAKSIISDIPGSEITSSVITKNENVLITIDGKGNGDVITHDYKKLRIVTFYNYDDGNKQMNDFYNSNVVNGSFTLKNDFTNDKFNGQLLCVQY